MHLPDHAGNTRKPFGTECVEVPHNFPVGDFTQWREIRRDVTLEGWFDGSL